MSMKNILPSFLLLGLVLAAEAAHAATLFTPPLVPDGQNQLDCYLVNVSEKVREATIQVLNRDGEVLRSVDVALNPGAEEVATVEAHEFPATASSLSMAARITSAPPSSCGRTATGRSAPCRPISRERASRRSTAADTACGNVAVPRRSAHVRSHLPPAHRLRVAIR